MIILPLPWIVNCKKYGYEENSIAIFRTAAAKTKKIFLTPGVQAPIIKMRTASAASLTAGKLQKSKIIKNYFPQPLGSLPRR
jgi:hypothetical protein